MGRRLRSRCAPYFRIFNPITQGEKFDKAEDTPENGSLNSQIPNKWLFRPWEATCESLEGLDLELGKNYPHPCVDHSEARARALQALSSLKDR